MKKVLNFVLIISMILSLGSCSLNDEKNVEKERTYEIEEINYLDIDETINKRINIAYPQIRNLGNDVIEKAVCAQIEAMALGLLDDFTSLDNIEMDVEYSITYASADIISIHFVSEFFGWPMAHPWVRSDSINIWTDTGERFWLTDMLDINEKFMASFFDVFEAGREYDSEETEKFIMEAIKKHPDYLERLASADGRGYVGICGYLTEDSIVISVEVEYAIGSYFLFEASYSDLEEFLKLKQLLR